MPELHVVKLDSYVRAEAELAYIVSLRPVPSTAHWEKEHAQALTTLIECQRAHNVARLNRCTAVYLKPVDLAFRFVSAGGTRRPGISLCRVVARKFHPFEHGPTVAGAHLHDDLLVSAAIWNAVSIAERLHAS